MKMIINLSIVETMLRKQYNLPDDCKIVLSRVKPKAAPMPNDLVKTINKIGALINSFDKIPAIKLLRELYPHNNETDCMGLGEAKFCIVNWEKFVACANKKCDWPVVGGDGYAGYTLS